MFRKGLSKKERLEIVEDIQDTQIEEMEQLQNEVLELKETILVLSDAVLQIMREKTTQNLKENFEKFGDVLKAMFSDIGKNVRKPNRKSVKNVIVKKNLKRKLPKRGVSNYA